MQEVLKLKLKSIWINHNKVQTPDVWQMIEQTCTVYKYIELQTFMIGFKDKSVCL